MNYSQDAFVRLMEEVEFQGGEHLDEVCADQIYMIAPGRGQDPKPFRSVRCKANAKFSVPYELEKPGPGDEQGLIKVCAVDDSMAAWPRFQDKVGWEGVTL